MADPSPAMEDAGDTTPLTRWLRKIPGSPRLGACVVLVVAVIGCAFAWSHLPARSDADLDEGFEELAGVDESLAKLGDTKPIAAASEVSEELILPSPDVMPLSEELTIPPVQSAAFMIAAPAAERAPAWLEGRIESADEPTFITPYRRGEHTRTTETSGPVLLKR